MADENALRTRRELLEDLYQLYLDSPSAQGIWHADVSDPTHRSRVREAEYLRAEGYISGTIGADGELALGLTPVKGRNYVEAGGFWTAESSPQRSSEAADRQFMRLAIDEARKSKSEDDRAHPMVGAVAVRDGVVLAKAHRGELGAGEHGEFTLLERKLADATLAGATIYVTLEPCTTRNHPKVSCASRLLERRVKRVVIGMLDPDHRISGRGQRALRDGGVETALFPADLAAEVEELNRHFRRSADEAARTLEAARSAASEAKAQPSGVHIAVHNSTIHGDVVGGNKNS